jgi:hypothetical protein
MRRKDTMPSKGSRKSVKPVESKRNKIVSEGEQGCYISRIGNKLRSKLSSVMVEVT